jgi:hypothetical protein
LGASASGGVGGGGGGGGSDPFASDPFSFPDDNAFPASTAATAGGGGAGANAGFDDDFNASAFDKF